jgi:hypothetical protein
MTKKKNHPLILGPCEDNEGYTVFKNTDEKMVEAIKNLKPEVDIFSTHNHSNSKIVQVLNDTQNLCIDEKDEYFIITNDELKNSNRKNFLSKINKEFNVVDAINKTFGTLYTRDGLSKLVFGCRDNGAFGNGYDDLGRIYADVVGFEMSTYRGLTLSLKSRGYGMFCYLDENGNIVNRDYNLDLASYLEPVTPLTKTQIIENIINSIPDVPYKKYGDKWFTDTFAYILETEGKERFSGGKIVFHLEKLDGNPHSGYKPFRGARIKTPKKAVEATKTDLLNVILPLINKVKLGGHVDLSLFGVSEIVLETTGPVKRVVETKLKESKYEVFDLRNGLDDYADADELKVLNKALEEIENSINIPENDEIIQNWIKMYANDFDFLPSYSFDKGQCQPDNSDFLGMIKLPHGCTYVFEVGEGDVVEISWSHSIYETDIINLELVV